MTEMNRINDAVLENVAGGQELYWGYADGYLLKAMGADVYNNFIDEGIDPYDVAEEYLTPQQMAEFRDILEKGTASPYYVKF